MQEVWKKIEGYEYYEVSNLGRVRSIDKLVVYPNNGSLRLFNGIIRKQQKHKTGYMSVIMSKYKDKNRVSVHRLVAEAFIPNPKNKPEVNHKNGIKDDNRTENLEWTTSSENRLHAIDMGNHNLVPIILLKGPSVIEFDSAKSCADYLGTTNSYLLKKIKKKSEYKGYTLIRND